ncbi:MAG: NAD(+) synthase [Oligoflexia bacterium]|nr:NAD(+) synthase [Oligoflexia bacterium]
MIKNISAVAGRLELAVRDFTDIAVVGTSGGVDSSVVASICVAALGKSKVHLVSMPFDDIDVRTFNARSGELATRLGAIHHVVAVGEACLALEAGLERAFGSKELAVLTRANVRPRVRMNVLYSICGELGATTKSRARVMGTGHLSEDLIGYDTKGGDALADIFILSELVKSEVYQLAKHYGVPDSIIQAEPSAGLYPGQTDYEELGFTYDELEPATLALFKLIQQGLAPSNISVDSEVFAGLEKRHVSFVVARYQAHFHKHQAPATVPLRNQPWFS